MRRIPDEVPPATTELHLKEWLYRLLSNINSALSKIYENFIAEVSMVAIDFTDQEPTALDTPLQVKFGAAQDTTDASMDANGVLTIKRTAIYDIGVILNVGRTGSSGGISRLFVRAIRNGVQIQYPRPLVVLIESADIGISVQFSVINRLDAGDTITFEIVRDSSGSDHGGLYNLAMATLDWGSSPSASLRLTRTSEVFTR